VNISPGQGGGFGYATLNFFPWQEILSQRDERFGYARVFAKVDIFIHGKREYGLYGREKWSMNKKSLL
jgi:hypothetical protein